jgi:hypothetical protein
MKAPDPALPPWIATCKREREAMIKWVLNRLDMQMAERTALEPSDDRHINLYTVHQSPRARLERAKRLARAGNVAPLQRLYPELAEFIHPPKRKRGQRRSYRDETALFERDGLSAVVEDVKRIRALWRQHYGLWKRRRDEVSAEKIAGLRHDMSEDEVRAAIKLLSR